MFFVSGMKGFVNKSGKTKSVGDFISQSPNSREAISKKRHFKGQKRDWVDISKHKSIAEERDRFGDLEIDTIIRKNHEYEIITINDEAIWMV